MSASSDEAVLLVSSSTARNLEFYSVPTYARLEALTDLVAEPHEITFDPNRRLAYITHTYRAGIYGQDNERGHEISVIDVDSRKIVNVIDIAPFHAPHDIEYDATHDLIYVGVEQAGGRNGVAIVHPTQYTVIGDVPLPARNAHWLAVTPEGKIYVTHKESEVVSVVDPATRAHVSSISVPGGAEELDADPRGKYVYVITPTIRFETDETGRAVRHRIGADDAVPRVIKIDTGSNVIVGAVEFDDYNAGMRVAADGTVLVTHMRIPDRDHGPAVDDGARPVLPSGELIVIDGETMTERGRVEVGPMPLTVRSSPDSTTAWVSSLGSGKVSVIDLAELKVVAELENNVGNGYGGTHGLAYVGPAGSGGQ